jgi:hypothetical protein
MDHVLQPQRKGNPPTNEIKLRETNVIRMTQKTDQVISEFGKMDHHMWFQCVVLSML